MLPRTKKIRKNQSTSHHQRVIKERWERIEFTKKWTKIRQENLQDFSILIGISLSTSSRDLKFASRNVLGIINLAWIWEPLFCRICPARSRAANASINAQERGCFGTTTHYYLPSQQPTTNLSTSRDQRLFLKTHTNSIKTNTLAFGISYVEADQLFQSIFKHRERSRPLIFVYLISNS